MTPALVLALGIALTPAQQGFEDAKATYAADVAVMREAFVAWQADPWAITVLEASIDRAIVDWQAIDPEPCFQTWYSLRYVSLLGLVDAAVGMRGGAMTPLASAAGHISELADRAEASVEC